MVERVSQHRVKSTLFMEMKDKTNHEDIKILLFTCYFEIAFKNLCLRVTVYWSLEVTEEIQLRKHI